MGKLLDWADKYLLEIGVVAFLIFIPLYPKWPLIDVPGSWVYIRLEDFLVATIVAIWLIQLFRRKVSLKVPLALPLFLYWLVGGISLLFSLIFLRAHLANFSPHVAVLHYLRRIEYMVIFLIVASTIKDRKMIKRYLLAAALALVGVCLYGFGQRFLGFPAYLTMNEEFAKGIPLYLPPTARITSTFGGHYDLAAYLVLIIALFGSLIFGLKRRFLQIFLFFLTFIGFILLLLTGSRISFAAYLIAISLVLYLQKKKWLIIPVILVSFFLVIFVSQASQRFAKTFRFEQVVYDVRTGKPIAALEEGPLEEELPVGTGFISLPLFETTPEATGVAVIRKSLRTATMAAEIATISGEFLIKRALVYDISFTTRFQGTWPRALNAFRRNPLLGTGYSSIGLGTDNSYLRALGETGILGFFSFLGLLLALGLLVKQGLARMVSPMGRGIVIGMTAGVAGLMFNALLIDVFESSKVAFTLWAFLGITVGMVNLSLPKRRSLVKDAIEVAKSPFIPIIILIFLTPLVLGSALGNYFVADDFTWLRWAGTSKISDIPQFFLSAQGFFYRPLAKTYFLLVHPIFGLRPGGYHLVDFLLHFGCVLGSYLLALHLTKKKLVALLASLLFLIHPINAESVFWISSTSALFASFFYLWGFLSYLQWRASKKRWRHLFFLATLLAFVLGLVSHERMITFPLVLLLYDCVFKQYRQSKGWIRRAVVYLPFLILTGIYLWIRNVVAQAHGFSGDYSYNLGNLVFNFAGNLFGYFGELTASFHFIPFYDFARVSLRSYKLIALGLLIVGLLIIKMFFRRLKLTRPVIFSVGWFIILLLPFLGLGNIAERHVYPAHFGLFLLLALFLNWIYERLTKRNFVFGLCLAIIIIGGILGFYLLEMKKAERDWRQAGEITNRILLALGSNYIEFALNTNLYFVNVPIRLNRAWVFPVGLEDGIWFVYRDETLNIRKMTDLEEALDLAGKVLTDHVFLYEDGELKEVRR